VPYIHANPGSAAEWRLQLAKERRCKVGIAWAGRPTHKADRYRSLTLAQLAPLAESGAAFFALQKGPAAGQVKDTPEGMRLTDCSSALGDFGETAALVAGLDLVITVDTAAAHLAGAMGKPVWMLVPFVPDWRWLNGRSDTSWYPTMRLVRQKVLGDWTGAIAEVARELSAFTKRMSSRA